MKPILFNTEMAQAILDNRKTSTRRIIKYSDGHVPSFYGRDKFYKLVNGLNNKKGLWAGFYKDSDVFMYEGKIMTDALYWKAPYQVGDILYVRETWNKYTKRVGEGGNCHLEEFYGYKANPKCSEVFDQKWHPSIQMPKEAARIFLKVTDVRVERVQDITEDGARAEGFSDKFMFMAIWDAIYNNALGNPWVWVIEFERVEK